MGIRLLSGMITSKLNTAQVWTKIDFETAISLDTKVSSILKDGCWNCPQQGLKKWRICNWVLTLHLISLANEDFIQWRVFSKSGKFTCSFAWNEIRVNHEEVNWWKLVWFRATIPKHTFICGLDIKAKLSTQDRLIMWGYGGDIFCEFSSRIKLKFLTIYSLSTLSLVKFGLISHYICLV